MGKYKNDARVVLTLDAGGNSLRFNAMKGEEFILETITLPSNANDLDLCLETMVTGFKTVINQLGDTKPVAISFAFPGPADYPAGIIGGFLPNFPSFRDGVALGRVDLVFGGRQAIDGDTAQVGPQVAEKLEIPQVTYAEELLAVNEREITIRRRLEHGTECVKAQLPALVTVTSAGADCRYPNAHRMLRLARTEVRMMNADDIQADMDRLGMKGSPTKVKKIESVVLAHKESVVLAPTEEALNALSATLIQEHIL